MRRSAVAAIAAVVLVSAVLMSSFVTGFVPALNRGAPLPPGPKSSGTSAKTVVVEVFTGTWCPPCANADPALSRILDEYDPANLVMLMYHLSDPYTNPADNARWSFYSGTYVPTMIVDGGGPFNAGWLFSVGASSDKGANYNAYRKLIDGEYANGTSLTMNLAADLTATAARANATITATDPVGLGNLTVRFVLYEDSLYYWDLQPSHGRFHRAVVRAISEQPLTISQGQTKSVTASFSLSPEPTWSHNKLGVAAFVQTETKTAVQVYVSGVGWVTHNKAEILQGARADFVTPGIVTYRDEPVTDYSEAYDWLLSNWPSNPLPHFRSWNTLAAGDTGSNDIRGPPSGAALAEHPMVIWYTGSQGAVPGSSLSPGEQNLLEGQLANGNGDLLLTGENIGADIGMTPFYSQVLQATYLQDNAGATAVMGVGGDPVSGTWSGTPLALTGTSPDVISPGPAGTATFLYQGTGQAAAIRSDFDADSRVVYMAYRYFEGPDANRQAVLASIISWFDAKAPPSVTVRSPNGGEVLAPGTPYKLTWSAKDVIIPSNGVDIYYTADSVSPSWVLIASGEPNDGVYWWTPPAGVDSDRCRLRVVVRDGTGQTGQDLSDADFTIGSPVHEVYNLTLQPGPNLVSFPFDPLDAALSAIFAGIEPNYDWIRIYDASQPRDPWVTWYRGSIPNELKVLDRTEGFWIDITSATPVTVTIQGLKPSSTSIPLLAGWNLVGFPSTRIDVTVASLRLMFGTSTMVTGPDRTSPYGTRVMADTDALATGSGYWVYVQGPQTWVVPYA